MSPLCSRTARPQQVLVGSAQWWAFRPILRCALREMALSSLIRPGAVRIVGAEDLRRSQFPKTSPEALSIGLVRRKARDRRRTPSPFPNALPPRVLRTRGPSCNVDSGQAGPSRLHFYSVLYENSRGNDRAAGLASWCFCSCERLRCASASVRDAGARCDTGRAGCVSTMALTVDIRGIVNFVTPLSEAHGTYLSSKGLLRDYSGQEAWIGRETGPCADSSQAAPSCILPALVWSRE